MGLKQENSTKLYCILCKYAVAAILTILSVSLTGFTKTAEYNIEGKQVHAVEKEMLVKFKEGIEEDEKKSIHRELGGQRKDFIKGIGVELIKIPGEGFFEKILDKYNSSQKVEYAEANIIYSIVSYKLPDQYEDVYEMKNNQWGLERINSHYGWEKETGLEETVIAIIDSGIDYDHPDLAPNMWVDPENESHGYDFVNEDYDPMDEHGHGTGVAGVAGAESSEDGIVGVCWKNSLMALKVLDDEGEGNSGDLSSAIIYAADKGAHVINISLGGDYSKTVENAVDYAYEKGVFLAAASGNSGEDSVTYPAALDNILAVGASNRDDERADFSNYGESLDVVAPGVGILSTGLEKEHEELHGTSMAAPFVSGLAALIVSRYENLGLEWSPQELKEIINSNARSLGDQGWDEETGYGIVDAGETLSFTTERDRPFVSTLQVVEKGTSTAELKGDLETLGEYDKVDVYFLYRQRASDTFKETSKVEKSQAGVFLEDIGMLKADTEYIYRAVADYYYEGSEKAVKGSTVSFYTYQKPPVKVEEDDPQYEEYEPEVTETQALIKWKGESLHEYLIKRNGVFLDTVTASSIVEYLDTGLRPDTKYRYEVFSINQAGEYDENNGIYIDIKTLPEKEYKPERRFITPSNSRLEFGLKAEEVLITDVKGRRIASLKGSPVIFDAETDVRGSLESGIYIYRIKTMDGEVHYGTIVVAK